MQTETENRVDRYQCRACSRREPQFHPQCPRCRQWDTFNAISPVIATGGVSAGGVVKSTDAIAGVRRTRCPSGVPWLDKAFGGGIVRGQRVLLGGGEGAGKSRLCLQVAGGWALLMRRTLYVCGEMMQGEVQAMARDLGVCHGNLLLTECVDPNKLCAIIDREKPGAVIVDSLNVLHDPNKRGEPDSPTQMKANLARVAGHCHRNRTPSVFLAHLNNRDSIAGPRWARHMVDCVALLTQDDQGLRTLRVGKNRVGPQTSTRLVMTEKGLSHA